MPVDRVRSAYWCNLNEVAGDAGGRIGALVSRRSKGDAFFCAGSQRWESGAIGARGGIGAGVKAACDQVAEESTVVADLFL